MTSLLEAERAFAAALRGDAAPVGCLALARLEIYRHSVEAARRAALAATYAATRSAMGEAHFERLAAHHARTVASTTGDLNDYGSDFAATIAADPLLAALAHLPDLARLEWAILEVARAPEAGPFDATALAALSPAEHADLRFRIAPASRLLVSPHPLVELYRRHHPEHAADLAVPAGVTGAVLIRRSPEGIEITPLEPAPAALYAAFARDETLACAVADVLDGHPDCDIACTLQSLIARGIVTGFVT
ncbi:MAG: putative DNA-binding domain-containing protein [Gammaproteobacteria bacterium]|nr:putative DNA-binding domain-containing protein [Gammaproteobacteria bacterium]